MVGGVDTLPSTPPKTASASSEITPASSSSASSTGAGGEARGEVMTPLTRVTPATDDDVDVDAAGMGTAGVGAHWVEPV